MSYTATLSKIHNFLVIYYPLLPPWQLFSRIAWWDARADPRCLWCISCTRLCTKAAARHWLVFSRKVEIRERRPWLDANVLLFQRHNTTKRHARVHTVFFISVCCGSDLYDKQGCWKDDARLDMPSSWYWVLETRSLVRACGKNLQLLQSGNALWWRFC